MGCDNAGDRPPPPTMGPERAHSPWARSQGSGTVAIMVFRLGSTRRNQAVAIRAVPDFQPVGQPDSLVLSEIDRLFVQAFALVGEGIAGATHALLAGDREAAKELVQRDEVVDRLTHDIAVLAQGRLVSGEGTIEERRELVAVLRMLTDLERNGDLAEHIARRAARGLGAEMSHAAAGSSSGWARWRPNSGGAPPRCSPIAWPTVR